MAQIKLVELKEFTDFLVDVDSRSLRIVNLIDSNCESMILQIFDKQNDLLLNLSKNGDQIYFSDIKLLFKTIARFPLVDPVFTFIDLES